jgi:regulator of replication initiation timing
MAASESPGATRRGPVLIPPGLDRILAFDAGAPATPRDPDAALPKPVLELPSDVYGQKFSDVSHWNIAGVHRGDGKGKRKLEKAREKLQGSDEHASCVVSVKCSPINGFYECLETNKGGFSEFTIHESDLAVRKHAKSQVSRIEKYLEKHMDHFHWFEMENEGVREALVALEKAHPVARTQVKIAVIYCREGQDQLMDFFSNTDVSPRFEAFLATLGHKVDLTEHKGLFRGDMGSEGTSYYTQFGDCEVMFHVAPLLSAEQHRRLVGNDVAVIFYQEGSAFVPSALDQLGTVPQVFAVVQPSDAEAYDGYELAFLERVNVKPPFGPELPSFFHRFSPGEMREFVLTRLINGTTRAFHCPPMNRLFVVPRAAALKSLVSEHVETRKEVAVRLHAAEADNRRRRHAEKSEKIVVSVLEARNLASKDFNGFSDPYTEVTLGQQKVKTKIIKKNLNPSWMETFELSLVGVDPAGEMLVQCWDWDRFSSSDFLGEVRIPVKKLQTDTDKWFPLLTRPEKPNEKISGDIHLKVRVKHARRENSRASATTAESSDESVEDAFMDDIGLDLDG